MCQWAHRVTTTERKINGNGTFLYASLMHELHSVLWRSCNSVRFCVCVGESEWQRRLWVPPCQASTSLDYGLQQLDLGMNASHECRPGHLPSHSISDIDDDDDNDTGCKRNSRSPSPTLITTGRTKRKLHRRIMENCSKTSNNFHIAKMLYASVSNRPSSIRPLQNAECILATKRATSSRAKK